MLLRVTKAGKSVTGLLPQHSSLSLAKSAARILPQHGARVSSQRLLSSIAEKPQQQQPEEVKGWRRARNMIRDYGASAVVIYSSLWIFPGILSYGVLDVYDNFGLDSNTLLEYVPASLKDGAFQMLGFKPDEKLLPWHTTALLAYAITDTAEIVRLPLTLFTAPILKRWWDGRATSSGDVQQQM